MTDKEKARAYDEAIKRAKEQYDMYSNPVLIEYIFPELAESEDEKIRKELIAIYSVGAKVNAKTGDISDRDIVAWLEKQKPNDNVDLHEDVDRILEENDWAYDEIDFYEFAKHFYELGLKNTERRIDYE